MSQMRPRGPYKKYLTDESASIPKRSRILYENSEEIEDGRPETGGGWIQASDCCTDEVNDRDEGLGDRQPSGCVVETHLCDLGVAGQPPCPQSPHQNHDNTLNEEAQSSYDLQSSSRRSECGQNPDQPSPSDVVPPARMMAHDQSMCVTVEGNNADDEIEGGIGAEDNILNATVDSEEDEVATIDVFLDTEDNEENEVATIDVFLDTEDNEEIVAAIEPQVHDKTPDGTEQEDLPLEVDQNCPHQQEEPVGILPNQQSLWKALRSDPQFTSPILTEVNCSPADILLRILAVSQQNNLSFKAFVDTARLVNSLFVSPVIPPTQNLLDKLLLSSTGTTKYFYCKKCTHYFGNVDHERTLDLLCPDCSTNNRLKDLTKASYFVLFSIDSQLELLFMNKEVWENLVDPKDAVRQNVGNILRDLYDGICYKDFVDSLPDNLSEKVLSFTFCTDGSPLFKSSNYSVWPCYLCINELPPLVRMKNLLLCGLWFGNRHPPMDLYLKPVVQHLKSLSDHSFKITVDEEEWQIRAYTIACCVDSGARGAVQGINSHSGYYSCNWCLTPGKWLDKVVFPHQERVPEPRTHDGLIEHGRECLNNDELSYVYGVQYVSPLVELPKFDIVRGMVQDLPHNVPFGIARTFLDEWLHNSHRSYYIGTPDELSTLQKKIDQLTPCIEVRRAVRLLKDMWYWKAREFENWILFYSLIVLLNVLPMKFWTHWSLLVQAVYLLSRDIVSTEDVNTAHRLIKCWVADVESIYGEKYMSFNVHIFSHLAENVARWGPSWAVSTYCFESAIGKLKKILHAQRGVPNQVQREISYSEAKTILMSTCQSPRTEIFLESIKSKPNKMTRYLPVAECVVVGKGDDFVPNDEQSFLISRSEFEIDEENCVAYSKIIASRCVYTNDKVAAGMKFNNSVALTTSGTIVIIKEFIMDRGTENVYLFSVQASFDELLKFPPGIRVAHEDHCVRLITSIGKRLKLLSVKQLKIVCVLTKMEDAMYVTPFHNLYNVC